MGSLYFGERCFRPRAALDKEPFVFETLGSAKIPAPKTPPTASSALSAAGGGAPGTAQARRRRPRAVHFRGSRRRRLSGPGSLPSCVLGGRLPPTGAAGPTRTEPRGPPRPGHERGRMMRPCLSRCSRRRRRPGEAAAPGDPARASDPVTRDTMHLKILKKRRKIFK